MENTLKKFVIITMALLFNCLATDISFAKDEVLQKDGKQYKPTYRECVKALEKGTVISKYGAQGAQVFYKNRGYWIVFVSQFNCRAWSYE